MTSEHERIHFFLNIIDRQFVLFHLSDKTIEKDQTFSFIIIRWFFLFKCCNTFFDDLCTTKVFSSSSEIPDVHTNSSGKSMKNTQTLFLFTTNRKTIENEWWPKPWRSSSTKNDFRQSKINSKVHPTTNLSIKYDRIVVRTKSFCPSLDCASAFWPVAASETCETLYCLYLVTSDEKQRTCDNIQCTCWDQWQNIMCFLFLC